MVHPSIDATVYKRMGRMKGSAGLDWGAGMASEEGKRIGEKGSE